jgi:hypothetical protein
MRLIFISSIIFLLTASGPAMASQAAHSVLSQQVKTELQGRARSCQLMTLPYQQLFADAASMFEAGQSCADGVKAMYELRRGKDEALFIQQRRRVLNALVRPSIHSKADQAIIAIRYRGTPPGWNSRKHGVSRETYVLKRLAGKWLVDSVVAKVRPLVAHIAAN